MQQRDTRTQATRNTTMSFTPSKTEAEIGDDVSFDINLTPGNNQVNFVKLVVKFDPTKLKATDASFLVNPNSNLSVLQGPIVGTNTISVALTIGNDATKVIQTNTKIGTLTFNVIDGPAENSQISFDTTTQVRSINAGNNDAFTENVFLFGSPASITITDAAEISPSPEDEDSNKLPVCNSLVASGPLTGEAPYDLSFTANGSDSDGTLTNFKFTFEPNESINIASSAADATSISVVTTEPHTYEAAGTYTTSVVLTDDQGGTSSSVACTNTVVITDADASGSPSSEDTDISNNTDVTEETVSPMPAAGPTEKVVGVGVLGGILLVIGTLLFFAL